ncbi:MAG: phosphatidylserine/phosphatidylglycerophosphate/cardiolipin synthase family protein [Congregibacter sp.]
MDTAYYRDYLEFATGVPFTDGNAVETLQNGDQIFAAMLDAINRAEHCVDFLTFVYWTGAIAEEFALALAARSQAGVSVRVLLDSYGAKQIPPRCLEIIEAAGVNVRWFRPLGTRRAWRIDKRTHRKILTADDRIGFTGGVGIAQEWTGNARTQSEWRDSHFRFDGPCVAGLKAAFLENWNEAGDWGMTAATGMHSTHAEGVPVQIIRSCSTVGWTEMAGLIRTLVSVSKHSLSIVTPYFVPDPKLIELLCGAAARGVDVRIMVPGEFCDERLSQLAGYTSVEELLTAGVQIFRYQHTNLHMKIIIVDGVVSCVGSSNLNHRSMGKDEECCAVVLSEALAGELLSTFKADLLHAEALDLNSWRSRSLSLRVKERLARLLVEQL